MGFVQNGSKNKYFAVYLNDLGNPETANGKRRVKEHAEIISERIPQADRKGERNAVFEKVNEQDAQEEYVYITNLQLTKMDLQIGTWNFRRRFMQKVLPEMIHFSNGVGFRRALCRNDFSLGG